MKGEGTEMWMYPFVSCSSWSGYFGKHQRILM